VQRATPATASSHAIGTDGSDELKRVPDPINRRQVEIRRINRPEHEVPLTIFSPSKTGEES
jgi:hypothetical protein